MDKIFIVDLPVNCIIGVYPEEKIHKQKLVFNITIESDLSNCIHSDNVSDTVDYEMVESKVIKFVEKSNYSLIETLAEKLSILILEEKLINNVKIRIDKPNALKRASSAAIEIIRTKN